VTTVSRNREQSSDGPPSVGQCSNDNPCSFWGLLGQDATPLIAGPQLDEELSDAQAAA